jgi:hypothetical protein
MDEFFDLVCGKNSEHFERSCCREVVYQSRLDEYAIRVDEGPVRMVNSWGQRSFRDYAGDGIAIDGDAVFPGIRDQIGSAVSSATDRMSVMTKVFVFAHSAGTVAAWMWAESVADAINKENSPISIVLILCGSPLRYYLLKRYNRIKDIPMPPVSKIINFVDRRDPVIAARGGGLSDIGAHRIYDVIVRNPVPIISMIRPSYIVRRFSYYHTGYMRNDDVISRVRRIIMM